MCFAASISACLDHFDQLVAPVLSYCEEILALFHFRSLEDGNFGFTRDRTCGAVVALKFYTALLGVNQQCCNAAVREQLARYSIVIKILKHAFDYGHRVANETIISALLRFTNKQ